MTYPRSGFGQACDASTMVTSVNGNYQCCPSDAACIAEAGLPTGTAPALSNGVGVSLQYGDSGASSASTPWWLWVLIALGVAGAAYAGAS